MSTVSKLLSGVVEVDEEVSKHDLESSSGGGFIKTGGVYETTIERAFISETKKGGRQLDIHFGGSNMLQTTLYIISARKNAKTKKVALVTTCQMNGKTVSLPDFKVFKQLMYVATGVGQDLGEIVTKEETIKFKKYGKDVEVEAETVVDLIGKTVNIAVRQEEKYAYNDGETDKTQLKVNDDGDILYDLSLMEVFSENGFNAIEMVKGETETKAMDSAEDFLKSDKGIKKVKLEMPEEEEVEVEEDEDDELEF